MRRRQVSNVCPVQVDDPVPFPSKLGHGQTRFHVSTLLSVRAPLEFHRRAAKQGALARTSMAPSSRWLLLLLANPTSMSSFDSREGPVAAVATWEVGALAVAECVTHLLAPTTAPCSALDAVERGINRVELDNADQYYVGVGGLPNADGVMELDAAVMDHRRRYGAVLALTDVPTPVSVARSVLERSPHSVLCGAGARAWAASQGFDPAKDAALTEESRAAWETWRKQQHPVASSSSAAGKNVMKERMEGEHDTVGVICLDRRGRLACGTSTRYHHHLSPQAHKKSPALHTSP